ncbi:MAG: hypothetical protein IT326_08275 [Anaerolineae bacterium]|nr:hypothetical protein [Anaerolineae bacterium]
MFDAILDRLISTGPLINRSLGAAIAIITASFFLYTLVRDYRNRIARITSALLFLVMITYISDLGVSYAEGLAPALPWLRFQWIGIAFVPVVHLHLSDALLEMTGLPSRGRRRISVRVVYGIAALLLGLAWFTGWIVRDPIPYPAPHYQPGPGFAIFVAYFVVAFTTSYWFIIRAYRRTLTSFTRRRMLYLLVIGAAPALAVFPFLLVSGRALESPLVFYPTLVIVDSVLAVMFSMLAYVLAFFGTVLPDRVIKAKMLQFFLRGPVVAIATLGVIVGAPGAGRILQLPGDEIMPFLAIAMILFLQWAITLMQPHLERWLIHGDQPEIRHLQRLERRLLTGEDFQEILETILTSLCDYLRVESAFVASISAEGPRLERAVGLHDALSSAFSQQAETLLADEALQNDPGTIIAQGDFLTWNGYWLIPLHFRHSSNEREPRLVGLLGVARPLNGDVEPLVEHQHVLMGLAARTAEVLEDRRLQSDLFTRLEGLLPEIETLNGARTLPRYGDAATLASVDRAVLESDDFVGAVRDALQHYWGGPRLTDSVLMRLSVVRRAMEANDANPQRAVRQVLQEAIENLRPEGQRSMTTTEWILYNILEMRFIQGRKVRDVAMRLAMSEADFYRKQRVAIENVAEIIAGMERASEDAPATGNGAVAPSDDRPSPAP